MNFCDERGQREHWVRLAFLLGGMGLGWVRVCGFVT